MIQADTLQLISTRRLCNTIFLLHSHFSSGFPVKCLESLGQDRVREMVACEHPISIHGAEVLDLKLDQRLGKIFGVSEISRKSIGLELVTTAENVHAQLDEDIHRREDIGEQDEANNNGLHGLEAKVCVQRPVVDEDREERKDVEEMELGWSAG